jgi:hypothetical protein
MVETLMAFAFFLTAQNFSWGKMGKKSAKLHYPRTCEEEKPLTKIQS